MKRLTGNGAGSGRGGVPKAPENTFLSFDLSVRRLPSAPPVVSGLGLGLGFGLTRGLNE